MVLPGTIWFFQVLNRVLYLWQPEAPKKVLWSTFFLRVYEWYLTLETSWRRLYTFKDQKEPVHDAISSANCVKLISRTRLDRSLIWNHILSHEANGHWKTRNPLLSISLCVFAPQFSLKWYSVLKNCLEIDNYNVALRWYTCTHSVYSLFNDINNSKCALAAVLLLSQLPSQLPLFSGIHGQVYFRVHRNKMSHRKLAINWQLCNCGQK